MAEAKTPNTEQKIWAAASYLWILSLVVLAARNKNDYIRFHANQGSLLFLVTILSLLLGPVGMLLNIIVVIAALMGIFKAMQGEKWELPIIGKMAAGLGNWIIKTLKL